MQSLQQQFLSYDWLFLMSLLCYSIQSFLTLFILDVVPCDNRSFLAAKHSMTEPEFSLCSPKGIL